MAKRSTRPGSHAPDRGVNLRALAAQMLLEVLQGQSLTTVFEQRLSGLSAQDQAWVKELSFGVCRYWPRLEWLTQRLLQQPLRNKDRDIQCLLLVGFYQLLMMRTATHAAVAETVNAVRQLKKPWATGLVNGVLRRLVREKEELLKGLEKDLVAHYACPEWLLQRLRQAWPERWRTLLSGLLQRPPLTLRIDLNKISRHDYSAQLATLGIPTRPVAQAPSALVLEKGADITSLPGFDDGFFTVQDAGAQLAAPLLACKAGEQVLDACAAPGGKSGHLLEYMPGIRLTAMDVDEQRLQRVRENLGRLGYTENVRILQGDATAPDGEWAQTRYDRILLDVPCSATGVIRRHPDIKLLRRDSDIAALVIRQEEILVHAWPLLKPGGRLLYATCSLLPEENHLQLTRFLSRQDDATELAINGDWGHVCPVGCQTLPGEQGMDGFYYACLQKRA